MVTCAAADCCVLAPVTQAEWAWGVWFAHRLFGILALYLMVVWSVLLLELTTLERAFCASGGATVACGIWLVLWVLLLLKTSVPTHELWDFAMADLAQMQHLAMGVLFVASGSAELYFATAVAYLPRRDVDALRWPHIIWGVCMAWIGVDFVVHPQRNEEETRRHVLMGLGIVAGSIGLALEKLSGDLEKDKPLIEAMRLIIAACSFGLAAVLLFTFPMPTADALPLVNVNATTGALNTTLISTLNATLNATGGGFGTAALNETSAVTSAVPSAPSMISAAAADDAPHRGHAALCHAFGQVVTLVGLAFGLACIGWTAGHEVVQCCAAMRRMRRGLVAHKQQQHHKLCDDPTMCARPWRMRY